MKKSIISLYFILIGSVLLAQSASESIAAGNTAYEEAEYEKAIQLYTSADSLTESAGLHLNLGNAYYKNGELGKAILHYERGKIISPTDEDILHNLRQANGLTLDKLESKEGDAFSDWWKSLLLRIGMNRLAYTSILTAILCALAWLWFWVSAKRSGRQTGFAGGVLLFIICISTMLMSFSAKKIVTDNSHAIILGQRVKIFSAPNDGSTELFILHEGAKVNHEEEKGAWTSISLPNGNKGWIESYQLEGI